MWETQNRVGFAEDSKPGVRTDRAPSSDPPEDHQRRCAGDPIPRSRGGSLAPQARRGHGRAPSEQAARRLS